MTAGRLSTAATTKYNEIVFRKKAKPATLRLPVFFVLDDLKLRGFLSGQRSHRRGSFPIWVHDSHLFPGVGKFFAAIEADHVRSSHRGGFVAAHTWADRDGKAVMTMPATEQGIDEFINHTFYPQNQTINSAIQQPIRITQLDSDVAQKVRFPAHAGHPGARGMKTVAQNVRIS